MGKIGDIGIVLGLGIVGGVLFMFGTGRWKLPSLPEIKFPELTIPALEIPVVTIPAKVPEPIVEAVPKPIVITPTLPVAAPGLAPTISVTPTGVEVGAVPTLLPLFPIVGAIQNLQTLIGGIQKLAAPKAAPTPPPTVLPYTKPVSITAQKYIELGHIPGTQMPFPTWKLLE